jgi:uncharacterized membrane protein YfcA
MKEKAIVSISTLLSSLAGYGYAKWQGKDSTPYLLIGAFIGSVVGEVIAEQRKKKNP